MASSLQRLAPAWGQTETDGLINALQYNERVDIDTKDDLYFVYNMFTTLDNHHILRYEYTIYLALCDAFRGYPTAALARWWAARRGCLFASPYI